MHRWCASSKMSINDSCNVKRLRVRNASSYCMRAICGLPQIPGYSHEAQRQFFDAAPGAVICFVGRCLSSCTPRGREAPKRLPLAVRFLLLLARSVCFVGPSTYWPSRSNPCSARSLNLGYLCMIMSFASSTLTPSRQNCSISFATSSTTPCSRIM